MPQSIMSVIKPGDAVCRFIKLGFTLTLSLFILFSPTRADNTRGNIFDSLSSLQQLPAANRSAPQHPIDAPVLAAGKPIERELAGGEAHAYQLNLSAGQYIRVLADQRRINVRLSVFDPE